MYGEDQMTPEQGGRLHSSPLWILEERCLMSRSLPLVRLEKGETAGEREFSLPHLLWRRLSSDHYDAATLPRKLFNWCSGQ